METCHQSTDFAFYEEMFGGAIRFEDELDHCFLRAVFRVCTSNPYVLLGDTRIDVKGMLSGIYGTSVMNTIKMCQVANQIDHYLQFGNDYLHIGD